MTGTTHDIDVGQTPEQYRDHLISQLTQLHGPLLSGDSLYRSLGFPSGHAFRQARRRGLLPIHTFFLPARRGHFALTTDVACWLCKQRFRRDETGGIEAMST